MKGTDLPEMPTGTVWKAGGTAEVAWNVRFNHGGGCECSGDRSRFTAVQLPEPASDQVPASQAVQEMASSSAFTPASGPNFPAAHGMHELLLAAGW